MTTIFNINKNDGLYNITFKPFSNHALQSVRELPGRYYDPKLKTWHVPTSRITHKELFSKLKEDGFWVELEKDTREHIDKEELRSKLKFQYPYLYGYQLDGVTKIISNNNIKLLGDSVGLGKTIQAMSIADKLAYRNVLIITPKSLTRQWQDELKKFLNQDAFIIEGGKKCREKLFKEHVNENNYMDVKFTITNYEMILFESRLFDIEWDFIIFDEIQRVKNRKTKIYKRAKILSKNKNVLGLSATAFSNNPTEMFNVISFLNDKFMTFSEFSKRFCVWETKEFGYKKFNTIVDYKNLDELNELLKRIMLRRTKEEVFDELPPITYKNYYIDIGSYQRYVHEYFKDKGKNVFKKYNPREKMKLLAYITFMRMAANNTKLLQLSNSENIDINIDAIEDKKLSYLVDNILPYLEGKTIIFTEWARLAHILHENIPSLLVTGETKNKDDILQKFKTGDDKILVSTDTFAQGINLECAQNIIHYDMTYSAMKIIQREGRIDRVTQQKKMLVIKLIAKNTIEEKIVEVLSKKKRYFDKVIDGKQDNEINLIINKVFGGNINGRKRI